MARFESSMYGARLFLGEKVAVSRPRARLGARPNQVKIKKIVEFSFSGIFLSEISLSAIPLSAMSLLAISVSRHFLSLSISKLTVTEDGQNDISMQQRSSGWHR